MTHEAIDWLDHHGNDDQTWRTKSEIVERCGDDMIIRTYGEVLRETPATVLADVGDAEFKSTEALPAHLRIERCIQENGPEVKETLMAECGIGSNPTFNNAVTRLRNLGKMPKATERQEGGTRLYRLC